MKTYKYGISDLLILDCLPHTQKVGIKPSLQTNHQLHARLVTCIDCLHRLSQISGNRLFAKHVLSIGSASLNLIGMVL